jgi:hypothetical protein
MALIVVVIFALAVIVLSTLMTGGRKASDFVTLKS